MRMDTGDPTGAQLDAENYIPSHIVFNAAASSSLVHSGEGPTVTKTRAFVRTENVEFGNHAYNTDNFTQRGLVIGYGYKSVASIRGGQSDVGQDSLIQAATNGGWMLGDRIQIDTTARYNVNTNGATNSSYQLYVAQGPSYFVGAITATGLITAAGATFSATTTIDAASGANLNIDRVSGQKSINSTDAYLIMDSGGTAAALNYFDDGHVVLAYGGGDVGISDTSPSYKLDVNGTARTVGDFYADADIYIGTGAYSEWAGHMTVYQSNGSDAICRFANPANGGYGIVVNASEGTKYVLKLGSSGGTQKHLFKGDGDATMVGTLTQNTSDIRLKDNRELIPGALNKLHSISGYSFDWNDKQPMHEAGTHDVGLIAQEVQEVLPEAVRPAPFDFYEEDPETDDHLVGTSVSGEDYLTIQYDKVVPLLVNAIKELSAKVEDLEAKLES